MLAAVLAGVLALADPAATATVTLSHEAARAGLVQAQAQGRPDLIWHLARGLIAADPDDYAAHAALAQAELQLGRPRAAAVVARQAQALAHSREQRFEAALLQARSSEQKGGPLAGIAAGFWARRAVELAPQDAYRQVAGAELRQMKTRAPVQLQFHLTLAPSSNLNNGTRETHTELPGWGGLQWELSPLSRALSGWYAEAGLAGRWRLHESANATTFLRFAGLRREVRLSGSARTAVTAWRDAQIAAGNTPPTMPNYDFGVIELGLGHGRRLGTTLLSATATMGHSWFGGHDLADYLRLEAGVAHDLSAQMMLFGRLGAERQWRKAAGQDFTSTTLQGGILRRLSTGDHLRLTLAAGNTTAANVNIRHQARSLRLGWEKGTPVAGVRIAASAGVEQRRHDPSFAAPAGRRDLRVDADLALTIERLDYMGFVPVINLTASRTNSNSRLHRSRDLGVSLGFRSRF